jgi:glycosyltransferase involved in cell wall biosynthesis
VRIALDATYSVGPDLTGIGIYSQKLVQGLADLYPEDRFLLCYRPGKLLAADKPAGPNVRRWILQTPIPIPGVQMFHALNQRIDRRPARYVVSTFHDLFVMTADYSTAEFRHRFAERAKQAAALSDIIIAVSSFVADQVNSLIGVERTRIRVVPHGVDLPPDEPPSLREDIILFVGTLQKRKNITRLVTAFERLPGNWKLILAGATGGYGTAEIMSAIEGSPVRARIEITGRLSDPALRRLYRRARIFAFPSLDEGFGIPVLEAMAYGLPVIASNRSALPEVAGDAAILVDPYSTEEIEFALLALVNDPARRDLLALCGRSRAAQFPWSRAADETHEVYRELIL